MMERSALGNREWGSRSPNNARTMGRPAHASAVGLAPPKRLAPSLTIIVGLLVGCGDDTRVTDVPPEQAKLRAIVMVYRQATQALGRPPKEYAELETVLANAGAPEDTVVSSRDGKRFAIVWGVRLDRYGGDYSRQETPDMKPFPLAYEREGIDGDRYATNMRGEVREVSSTEFASFDFPDGHKPPDTVQ